jgi:tropomyosin-2
MFVYNGLPLKNIALMKSNPFFTDDLFHEKEKYKSICDDLDQTFSELTGY